MASDNFMSLLKIMKNQEKRFKIGKQNLWSSNSNPCFIFPLFSPTTIWSNRLSTLTLKTQFSKYFLKIGLFDGFSGFHAIYLVDKILGKARKWCLIYDENFRSNFVTKTRQISIKKVKCSPASFQA
jgi:hypothetical protein